MKVIIIADMEGMAGIVSKVNQCVPGSIGYRDACILMTKEVNAAVEGALEAGATEIIVRDSHSSGLNILPDLLNKKAKVILQSAKLLVDDTFDAALLVGHHAKAGSNGVLPHTYSRSIAKVYLNNIEVGEIGLEAALCGHYNIPVAFVSGCSVTCEEAKNLLGDIETVITKVPITGTGAISRSVEEVRKEIKDKTKKALKNVKNYKPFRLQYPVTLKTRYYKNYSAKKAAKSSKSIKFIGNRTTVARADNIVKALNLFRSPKTSLFPPLLKLIYSLIRKKSEDLGIY